MLEEADQREIAAAFRQKLSPMPLCRAYVVEGTRIYRKCNAWGATTPIRRPRRADEFRVRLVCLRRGRSDFHV